MFLKFRIWTYLKLFKWFWGHYIISQSLGKVIISESLGLTKNYLEILKLDLFAKFHNVLGRSTVL